MLSLWIYSLGSVLVVSLVSLVGIFTLSSKLEKNRPLILHIIAFAAGVLLGDAFIHLLPEAVEEGFFGLRASLSVLAGIVTFLALEKIIFWRHCHIPTTENHTHPVGTINLIGDAFHNFVDGIIIAGSFLVDPTLGLATAIAVFFHEIPQEIGDFSILIHAGYTRARALLFNFISALSAVLGATLTLLIGSQIESITTFLVPFTIGGFIYIATADLIPEIHREEQTFRSFLQFFYFLVGVGVMSLLLLLE